MIAIVVLLVIAACLSLLGKRLNLYSNKLLSSSSLYNFALFRFLFNSLVGLIWVLSKISFPCLEMILTYGFDNKIGRVMRTAYWKARVKELGTDVFIDVGAKAIGWQNITIGDQSWIDRNVILETGTVDKSIFQVFVKKNSPLINEGELRIGKGCHISKDVVIQSFGGVFIGDFTGIASGSKIYSLSHHYKNPASSKDTIYKFTPCAPVEDQSLIQGCVVFEGNNALGLNSVVLPGVIVGMNTWIGICSYVIEDIPPNSIAVGCPVKVVKKLR